MTGRSAYGEGTTRCIVTVGFGKREDTGRPNEEGLLGTSFYKQLIRCEQAFARVESVARMKSWNNLPPGCPSHVQRPYAFKAFALQDAADAGYTTLLWADSSIVPVHNLRTIWEKIERDGWWFANNSSGNCGEWISDAALDILGVTRQEAFRIPQIVATCFGLDLTHTSSREFLSEFLRLAQTPAMCGSATNDHFQASGDRRVKGHRWDQSVMSIIAWKLGMRVTQEPKWFLPEAYLDATFLIERSGLSLGDIVG